MFIHRENTLKRLSRHHIVLYKEMTLKNNFNAKSDQNIHHKTYQIGYFFKNFPAGEHASYHVRG